jgi:excinuclease UvrABC helicase subunit UvrB
LNHTKLRHDIYTLLIDSELLNNNQIEFLNFVNKSEFLDADIDNIDKIKFPNKVSEIYQNTKDNTIFQLFPYVSSDYDPEKAIKEIKESINNLKTRLSNLKKINKSLNDIEVNSSSLTWDELKNITFSPYNNEDLLE